MGTNQHLYRSIAAIIKQGGIKISVGEVIMPEPILVGRNEAKLKGVAEGAGLPAGTLKVTTNLDEVLHDKKYSVYFDSQTTDRRVSAVKQAIAAGQHIYCEKPTAINTQDALELYHLAQKAGVKNGVVQDKLWLPGIMKLKELIASGFFGKILSVRGEFGYWVFEGDTIPAQRPSWNYRKEDGGGLIIDMLCHWRYLVDNVFGSIKSVSCLGATHIKQRWDEAGKPYKCTADDSGVHHVSSWKMASSAISTVRGASACGGMIFSRCKSMALKALPSPVCVTAFARHIKRPLVPSGTRTSPTRSTSLILGPKPPRSRPMTTRFKIQWELFLKHVVKDTPFRWSLLEGAKGVQLAEKGLESWQKRAWLDLPPLK